MFIFYTVTINFLRINCSLHPVTKLSIARVYVYEVLVCFVFVVIFPNINRNADTLDRLLKLAN